MYIDGIVLYKEEKMLSKLLKSLLVISDWESILTPAED